MAGIWHLASTFERSIPTDIPIRFNRYTKKIYWKSLNYMNPLGPLAFFHRIRPRIETWDWENVRAEIVNQRVRYVYLTTLDLILCKPETHEVVAREFLFSTAYERSELELLWAYICCFMQHGPKKNDLLDTGIRGADLDFIHSVFEPYFWYFPDRKSKNLYKHVSKTMLIILARSASGTVCGCCSTSLVSWTKSTDLATPSRRSALHHQMNQSTKKRL